MTPQSTTNEYRVWNEDDGREHGSWVDATDPGDAAEKWADEDDWTSAEYAIVSGRNSPIVVVEDVKGNKQRFRVTGESVAVYTAALIEQDKTE